MCIRDSLPSHTRGTGIVRKRIGGRSSHGQAQTALFDVDGVKPRRAGLASGEIHPHSEPLAKAGQ